MASVSPIRSNDILQSDNTAGFDWKTVAYLTLLTREIDDLEENELLKARKIIYQFSSRGHDMAQAILGSLITHPRDATSPYYRSRALMLKLGLSLDDAIAGPMMRAGGLNDGRDIGVVFNLPNREGPCALS